MGKRKGRRAFGSIRQLGSGRFQARVRNPISRKLVPIGVFPTYEAADAAIAAAQTDQSRGGWVDPARGRVAFGTYADAWIAERCLRRRTEELYEGLLRNHIYPTFKMAPLEKISTSAVRTWYATLRKNGVGAVTVAKAYRLLRAILNTAVADEVIVKNPCTLKGAGEEHSAERPVCSEDELWRLVAAIDDGLRALLLLAVFAHLRLGELRGLRRRNLNLLHREVVVVEQVQQITGEGAVVGAPKTDAGQRRLRIPDEIVPDLEAHLARRPGDGPDAFVFPNDSGGPLRPGTFYRAWGAAKRLAGVDPAVRLHDLRHTGNTWAAADGASIKELMRRMGHSTMAAAVRYQHATDQRDAEIAAALGSRAVRQRRDPGPESHRRLGRTEAS